MIAVGLWPSLLQALQDPDDLSLSFFVLLWVPLPFVADAVHVTDQTPPLAFLQKTASGENQELTKARGAHVELTLPLCQEPISPQRRANMGLEATSPWAGSGLQPCSPTWSGNEMCPNPQHYGWLYIYSGQFILWIMGTTSLQMEPWDPDGIHTSHLSPVQTTRRPKWPSATLESDRSGQEHPKALQRGPC